MGAVRRLLSTMSVTAKAFSEDRGGGEEDLLEGTWRFCGETYGVKASSSEHGFTCEVTGLGYVCHFDDASHGRRFHCDKLIAIHKQIVVIGLSELLSSTFSGSNAVTWLCETLEIALEEDRDAVEGGCAKRRRRLENPFGEEDGKGDVEKPGKKPK